MDTTTRVFVVLFLLFWALLLLVFNKSFASWSMRSANRLLPPPGYGELELRLARALAYLLGAGCAVIATLFATGVLPGALFTSR